MYIFSLPIRSRYLNLDICRYWYYSDTRALFVLILLLSCGYHWFCMRLKWTGCPNNIILCGLPSRSPGWKSCGLGTTWWCLVLLSCLLDPHTLHITCIRHSVSVTCKLWFAALFLYVTSIACLFVLQEGSFLCGSSWGFFHHFSFTLLKDHFFPSTWQVCLHSHWGSKDRGC